MGRGLFNRFQERVECFGGEIVDFIDDEDLIGAHHRLVFNCLDDGGADIVDA